VRRGASVLGWTVLVWALNVLCIEFTANAFPFGAELGFWDAATVLVVLCVALIAPAPPGFAGVFELGCAIALTIYGVAPSEAAAFAVLLHGAQFALIAAFGLFFAATDNVALGKLARSAPERG
jgi:uncharacterized membrane protein YbhN (UPF0104 family)